MLTFAARFALGFVSMLSGGGTGSTSVSTTDSVLSRALCFDTRLALALGSGSGSGSPTPPACCVSSVSFLLLRFQQLRQ